MRADHLSGVVGVAARALPQFHVGEVHVSAGRTTPVPAGGRAAGTLGAVHHLGIHGFVVRGT